MNQPKAFINRKDYAITWNAAVENGGVLVSDKITLEFEGLRDQDRLTVTTQSMISAH